MNQTHINQSIDFIKNWCPYARAGILFIEVYANERSLTAVQELRDAFHLISLAVNPKITDKECDEHLLNAKKYIVKASIYPIECECEELRNKILRLYVNNNKWKRFLKIPSLSIGKILKIIEEGEKYLSEGIKYKGTSIKDSYENMIKAYRIFSGLFGEIYSPEFYGKKHSFIIMLISTVVTFLMVLFLKRIVLVIKTLIAQG